MLKMIRTKLYSLPNILAGEELVPELIQQDATGQNLASEVLKWLEDEPARDTLNRRFREIHSDLRCDASQQAADAVSGLLER